MRAASEKAKPLMRQSGANECVKPPTQVAGECPKPPTDASGGQVCEQMREAANVSDDREGQAADESGERMRKATNASEP